MTRFMMNLDKPVRLVEHAMMNGKGGELFVQKHPLQQLHKFLKCYIKFLISH